MTMHTVRTRVSAETFAVLEQMTGPETTLAATVRNILDKAVAGATVARVESGSGIPAAGCFCHDPSHVMCWGGNGPNPDCHCCTDTANDIIERRNRR